MPDYDWLYPYTSNDRHREILRVLREAPTVEEASKRLGVTMRNVYAQIGRLRAKADEAGAKPHVPPGHKLIGQSTLTKTEDGEPQWIKTKLDPKAATDAAKEYIAALCEDIPPRKKTKAGSLHTAKDLMTAYPLGDHHWGMYAYAAETGDDYDLKIAKRLLTEAVDYLVDTSPPAEEGWFINLGDYLHADNRSNATPMSGHTLDVDSRFSKVIRMASYGMSAAVERMLQKHKRVRITNVSGNHDQDSAHWLDLVQEAWFRNEPRVTVDTSPAQYLYHQFGKNMICVTHGHTCKLIDLPGIMASNQPKMWGDTTYRVAWTGHVHHGQTIMAKDNKGAIAESFPVLCPNDAYNASRGYASQREMHAITFKESGGILSRITYNAGI